MNAEEIQELERAIHDITEIAEGFGLDFYPMRYEICPADIIYTFGAYGMPTRFSHWSFGKAFHSMKMQYDYGLSKIYELVINSNPCYAFLLDGNSLIQNKMIAAHVLAHCDFFKNNIRFSKTNREMVESMSATADRVRRYEIEYGTERVETFLDAVLALQEHIEPGLLKPYRLAQQESDATNPAKGQQQAQPTSGYEDLWSMERDEQSEKAKLEQEAAPKPFPAQPEKDLMWFIQEYSHELDDWQRDIMTMLRDEMLYFWPQIETKIMNEGWASVRQGAYAYKLSMNDQESSGELTNCPIFGTMKVLKPYGGAGHAMGRST